MSGLAARRPGRHLRAGDAQPPAQQVAHEGRSLAGADLRAQRIPQTVLNADRPVRSVGIWLGHDLIIPTGYPVSQQNGLALDIR